MNRARAINLSALVVLGAASYFASTQLLAKKGGEPSSQIPVPTKVLVPEGGMGATPSKGSVAVQPIARFTINKFEIVPDGLVVSIDVEATIRDSRAGRSYLWAAVVRDAATRETLRSIPFFDGMFTSEATLAEPERAVRESIELDEGSYHVELRLYDVTTNPDLDLLAATDDRPDLIITRGGADIELR